MSSSCQCKELKQRALGTTWCVNTDEALVTDVSVSTSVFFFFIIINIENNSAAVKVRNEVSNCFCINSGVKQGCVLPPFIWIILMDFVLRSTEKAIGDHGIKWGGKILLDLVYADDLSLLDESVSKMNELLEVLQVQGARIGLKINVKRTKSLRLGISEDEKVTLGNEKIDQVCSFTYFGSIISKDGWSSEDVKSRIAKAQGVVHS